MSNQLKMMPNQQQGQGDQAALQILAFLQNQCVTLKDHINQDLKRIGVSNLVYL